MKYTAAVNNPGSFFILVRFQIHRDGNNDTSDKVPLNLRGYEVYECIGRSSELKQSQISLQGKIATNKCECPVKTICWFVG